MKQSTLDKLAAVLTEPNAMVDPTLVMAFLSAVITAWKSCRNPEVAKAQTLAGGPVAYGQAIKIVRQETDLRGKPARLKAMALVEAGTKLSPDEIAELENESKDVPSSTSGFGVTSIPVGIFQLSLLLLCLLFFAAPAQAQSGIFQIDIEQNRRLDIIEKRLDDISKRIGLEHSPGLAQRIEKALQSTPAYEIINGVQTHTSDAHLLFHGYTAAQIAGLTPDRKDRLHGEAHASSQKTVSMTTAYMEVCNGRRCRRIKR